MKAIFEKLKKPEKFNINHRKENHFAEQITAVAINAYGRAYDCVTLRIYATDARCYACIWTSSNCAWKGSNGDHWRHGSGLAGGYGYHRASAAAEEAIINAGIVLDEHISGRGDGAMAEAVKAIARAIWTDEAAVKIYITTAHA